MSIHFQKNVITKILFLKNVSTSITRQMSETTLWVLIIITMELYVNILLFNDYTSESH